MERYSERSDGRSNVKEDDSKTGSESEIRRQNRIQKERMSAICFPEGSKHKSGKQITQKDEKQKTEAERKIEEKGFHKKKLNDSEKEDAVKAERQLKKESG